MERLGGADPLGSSQGVLRGERFVHPVGPGSGFLGMDGWGQQSHDRQIGFPWVPQDGHHAYPVGPVSVYHDDRQIGFPQGAPQDWQHAYPEGPCSGFPSMEGWQRQGVSRQRAHPYDRRWRGGMRVGMNVCIMGGGYSEDHTIQVDLVLAQITEIGVARVVICKTEFRPWYREEGVRRRFLRRSVGSRGVAGRGSAATGPTGSPGRGKGRGVTVAQSPAQLARAAAQRDARKPGQRSDARQARAELCWVAESRPWYRAGDSK